METVKDRDQLDINLSSYAKAAQHNWRPAIVTFFGVMALAVLAAFLQEPVYRSSAQLLYRVSRTPALTGLGEGTQDLDTLVYNQNPLVTETKIISSQKLLAEVADALNSSPNMEVPLTVQDIRENLQVEILPGANVVEVTYESNNPENTAMVINALTEAYVRGNYESRRAEARQAMALIEQQIPRAEAMMRRSEDALRRFKEENGVILLEEQAGSIVTLMQDLDSQILITQAALQETTSRFNQLHHRLNLSPQEALIISDLSQSSGVQGTLLRLQEIERELAIEQGFYTEDSPIVENLRDQETNLRKLLQNEVDSIADSTFTTSQSLQISNQRQEMMSSLIDAEIEHRSLQQRLEVLTNARSAYNVQAGKVPLLEQRQAELNSQLQVARQNYQSLLQKQEELRIAENQASGNVLILEPASVPENPSISNRIVIIALGMLVGALLSITVVFFLEISHSAQANQLLESETNKS